MTDDDGTTANFLLIEGLDRPEAFFFAPHHDEGEPAGTAGMAIEDYLSGNHGAVILKQLREILVGL